MEVYPKIGCFYRKPVGLVSQAQATLRIAVGSAFAANSLAYYQPDLPPGSTISAIP
jgi:hypothetical protein